MITNVAKLREIYKLYHENETVSNLTWQCSECNVCVSVRCHLRHVKCTYHW